MAAAAGRLHKALLPVAGVLMLLAWCRRCGLRLRCADRGVHRGAEARAGRTGTGWDGVLPRAAAESPARSAAAALDVFGAPVLVATPDHALLTSGMVEHFRSRLPAGRGRGGGAGAARNGARGPPGHAADLAALPRRRLFGLQPFPAGDAGGAGRAVAFWRRVEGARKRPLALAWALGPLAVLRFALGRLALRGALDALGRRCGARLAAVEMPFADAAVDVDKPEDLALVEAALRRRPAEG
jgi:hypothetical protein